MKKNTLTLDVIYSADVLAKKCNERTEIEKNDSDIRSASCPIGICTCPFEDIACEDVSPTDWNSVLKEIEVPFRKGELVAVRDNHNKHWQIKIFHSYVDTKVNNFKYRVFDNIDDLDERKCTNYENCEKLSVFSKKFFFE